MKMPRPITIDFETRGIESRPLYPPVPVGVSIKRWGKNPVYHSWGHKLDNSTTFEKALLELKKVWDHPDGLLFQNAKFDVDVANVHLGLPIPDWRRIHDVLFLLFLDDPHQRELGLKPAAERLLNQPPDEQDAVAEWLVTNQPIPGVKISSSKNGREPFGKYIEWAPGKSIVGPYANGDTDRTESLFRLLYPRIMDRKMISAYDREREIMPIFLDMERRGIRVDLEKLTLDVFSYQAWRRKIDLWVRRRLKVGPDVNLESDQQLLGAMEQAGVVDTSKMGLTPTGRVKMDKSALLAGVTDKVLAAVLKYNTQLKTCLSTFMEPWLETARKSGGLIFTTWHQTRSSEGRGTRTGRLSSTPNFQNIPKEFGPIFDHEEKGFPKCPWKDLPPLPLCRSYIIPYSPDDVLIGRDYSQQEPRILAHFEDGSLKEQYQANPWIDYHDNAKEHLERVFKRPFKRKAVKTINLGLIYGQGISSLALKNGETYDDTKALRDAIFAMYPGLRDMYSDMRARAQAGEPIRTWGGREYYCEPPAIINGRVVTFDYKMVNMLIQSSAADCNKEAMIRWFRSRPDGCFMHLSVHDELVLSVPRKFLREAMENLRVAMESVEFDVKILSEGAWSDKNWGSMMDYDKRGTAVHNLKFSKSGNFSYPNNKKEVA